MSQVRASHILVKSEKKIKEIAELIEKGKSFEDMARAHSDCPSGVSGGDLSWFGKGMMVKPFEEAAFKLNVGEISGPVQTQFGFHLIKVTGKK